MRKISGVRAGVVLVAVVLAAGCGSTMLLTMTFSDFGVPVSAQAPDPGLVDPMPR
jgi:hypothetical protein